MRGHEVRATLTALWDRRPVIAVVAGSGQVARAAGADLLVVLNAGFYRTVGTGSLAPFLPYGNANA